METVKAANSLYTRYSVNQRKRILFACVPADGHFNPLTGLAVHLQQLGYDVRWYTSVTYADKLNKLQIRHYPLKRALDVSTAQVNEMKEQRSKLKGKMKTLVFDLVHGFIKRAPEYLEDMQEIYATFPFDMVVCDCAFLAIPFVKEVLKVPVISIGVMPLTETSRDLAPMGLGLTPATSFWGKRKQDILRFVADKVFFRKPNKLLASMLRSHGITMNGSNLFDVCARSSSLVLQSGTPGFEYHRSDLGANVRFIGPLLPFSTNKAGKTWYNEKLTRYKKVILVTQGTVEKDVTKLLVPTIDAFKGTSCLVIVATGGSGTEELQAKYPHDNLIIEDFIPFNEVMPFLNVYVTNGGYGGVMLSIMNRVPMVVAGVHEGKNEINARIGYFNLGINLQTERPTPQQLRTAVEKVSDDKTYRQSVHKLGAEFKQYDPHTLSEQYITGFLGLW